MSHQFVQSAMIFTSGYFPVGICKMRDFDANPPFSRAERSSYWSLAIKSTPAWIAACQRNDAFSRDPKLYPLSQPVYPQIAVSQPVQRVEANPQAELVGARHELPEPVFVPGRPRSCLSLSSSVPRQTRDCSTSAGSYSRAA